MKARTSASKLPLDLCRPKAASFAFTAAMILFFGLPVAPHSAAKATDSGWPRAETGQKLHQMRRYVYKNKAMKVVFVGSSMMADAIDPVLFTKLRSPAYNAAFSGPSVRTVSPWVRNVVRPLISPKVIVIETATRDFNDNSPKAARYYDAFVNSPGYIQASSNPFKDSGPVAPADKDWTLGPRGKRIEDPVNYVSSRGRKLYENNLIHFSVGGIEYHSLKHLIRELVDKGVKPIVMDVPITKAYVRAHAHPKRDLRVYHYALHRLVRRTGVTFVDAEKAFPTSAPFRNIIHLDVEGRRALTVALARHWHVVMTTRRGHFKVACNRKARPTCHLGDD